ncbi:MULTISPECIES: hypothetical protein [unclassified Mesorhizobium]|uniref:hypothetical protein n=1 Tax=unclassified Mesorhizobium TaxID=325217 RepID=UPI001127DE19|nr:MULTISPECIES: hypothetical protein [unclassified Mesorhizobium]MBZ9701737.1 hypothetical protein [Mesorhizobium sp. CO1-1-3]MBZ9949085.1 hypothetical protein [Mesorhizobium sp. BR1-1-11]TPI99704.1 hypothetical protein FJ428_22575 [Mesorhizobium sp. B2-8-1]
MAWEPGIPASVLVLAGSIGAFSMTDQTLEAKILDHRVVKCGVTIESGTMTTLRPFIQTTGNIAGKIAIKVQSRAGSNTNLSSQTVSFPGNSVITVGRPTNLKIEMVATSEGSELCRLSEDIDFDAQGIRI